MDKSTFIQDQRKHVLKAIRQIHSDFKPVYTPPQLAYSNKLLDSLNGDIESIEIKPKELVNGNFIFEKLKK